MEEYLDCLNNAFSQLIKSYNKFQISDNSKSNLELGNNSLKQGIKLLSTLTYHVTALENAIAECKDHIAEIEDDLGEKPRAEDYVYSTAGGMLSYRGRDIVEKLFETKQVQKAKPKPEQPKDMPKIMTVSEINYPVEVPVVTDLKKIPMMFHWYNGTAHRKGLYCQLTPGIFIRAALPETIDSTKEQNRGRTIRCKYKTKKLCDDQRSKMAKFHNSTVRTCNFVHSGDRIIKVGYQSRCSFKPNFGSPETLTPDVVRIIDEDDCKNILLYGISDMLTGLVWLNFHKKNEPTVYDSLEMAV